MSDLAKDDIACAGVRGIQGIRRSRASSVCGKARSKVRSAKDYLNKHGLEADIMAEKLLRCGLGSFGMDLAVPTLKNKGVMNVKPSPQHIAAYLPKDIEGEMLQSPCVEKPSWTYYSRSFESYEDMYNVFICDPEEFDGKSCTIDINYAIGIKNQACRQYYCSDIFSYEQFYHLVGGDHEQFDDQQPKTNGMKDVTHASNWYCRQFYCKDISSYEELYNITGDEESTFDDQHTKGAENDSTIEIHSSHCWSYYGKEIQSYEEFFNMIGGDHEELDNLHPDVVNTKACPCRFFYGKEIESYEEFYNIVAGDQEDFDDEHVFGA